MAEFWEQAFRDKKEMWGHDASPTAAEAASLFKKSGARKILIPGFGYGRNARVFIDSGLDVTGIEISESAIDIARKNIGDNIRIYHGPVDDMPFDDEIYDGIYCYALVHLLNTTQRKTFIEKCWQQLARGGSMVFVAISTKTPGYGQGRKTEKNTFLTPHGVTIFYYDEDAVQAEFGAFGMIDAKEIKETPKQAPAATQVFWQITCVKPENV